jgi:Transcriptional regulator
MPSDLRSRKRIAMRRAISEVADRLFRERGFDNVTVDEIAVAADVGRMTVFNHFPRKEDMFFDRDEEAREEVREALRGRDPAVSPIETLRLLAHYLLKQERPYLTFSPASQAFIATVAASETLKARARAIRDEITGDIAAAMSDCVGRKRGDPDAHLAAGLLVAMWSVAFLEAHRTFEQSRNAKKAKAVFLALIDRASTGVAAAMAGTPYAKP